MVVRHKYENFKRIYSKTFFVKKNEYFRIYIACFQLKIRKVLAKCNFSSFLVKKKEKF